MDCPRTGKPLKAVKVGGIEVDISEGCGGVWFDNHELKKFTPTSSALGKVLAEHLKSFHKLLIDDDKRLNCPKDTDVVMMRRYFSAKQQIEIDECPACGGVWLDSEELDSIHDLFPKNDDFEKTQQKFVNNIMASPEVAKHKGDNESLVEKLKVISDVFQSMVRSSYY